MSNIGFKIKITKLIGEGSTGEVFLAHNEQRQQMAVKVIKNNSFGISHLIEPLIMAATEHPAINRALAVHIKEDKIFLIEEYAISDLAKFSTDPHHNLRSESLLHKWIFDLVSGVRYLRHHQIIHADLKASNILVYADLSIRITDFSSTVIVTDLSLKTHRTGTLNYCPPEVLGEKGWSYPVDIWALACTLHQILFCESIFPLPQYAKCSECKKCPNCHLKTNQSKSHKRSKCSRCDGCRECIDNRNHPHRRYYERQFVLNYLNEWSKLNRPTFINVLNELSKSDLNTSNNRDQFNQLDGSNNNHSISTESAASVGSGQSADSIGSDSPRYTEDSKGYQSNLEVNFEFQPLSSISSQSRSDSPNSRESELRSRQSTIRSGQSNSASNTSQCDNKITGGKRALGSVAYRHQGPRFEDETIKLYQLEDSTDPKWNFYRQLIFSMLEPNPDQRPIIDLVYLHLTHYLSGLPESSRVEFDPDLDLSKLVQIQMDTLSAKVSDVGENNLKNKEIVEGNFHRMVPMVISRDRYDWIIRELNYFPEIRDNQFITSSVINIYSQPVLREIPDKYRLMTALWIIVKIVITSSNASTRIDRFDLLGKIANKCEVHLLIKYERQICNCLQFRLI